MNALHEIMLLREAASVQRYHTQRMQRKQELNAHSYGVAMLVQHLYPECSRDLLLAALYHDLPEYFTGDVPAPAKRGIPQLAVLLENAEKGTGILYREFNLTVFDEALLKWCDTFELVLFCLEEVQMGNTYALAPLYKGLEWCTESDMIINSRWGEKALTMLKTVAKSVGPYSKENQA